jgi:eukaryotic-like serine/threonine-protein kinase
MLQSHGMPVENAILQSCPACGASIDTTTAEPLAKIACPKCGEKARVERSFNNFVLVETLGVGGMGTVYKARDTLLDRLVALKLLRKDLGAGIDQTAQLQQEARVAASVNHPNVIQVFSSGIDHSQFYLVMELVDHGSLDDFIEERKRLPEEQVLEAGIQVAKGLRAAQAKGLIHRDVKPANILFADEHTAKIGDFGLAGVAAERSGTAGEIWGTPYYVAPERLRNDPEDFRSDIYSLGATLFHAAAGKAPIEGDTNSALELLALKKKPIDVRKIAPEVSAATARVLHRMIAPDPDRRFASYDDLVNELERAHQALTGKETPDGISPGNKKMRAVAIAGVVAIVLAFGAFLWLRKSQQHQTSNLPSSPSIAVSEAELERRFADGRRELVRDHHKIAHAAFVQVALDAKNRQPIYDWIRLNQGLAALISREQSQAQEAFQEIENAGQVGFKKEEIELAKNFVATAKTMTQPGIVPPKTLEQPENPLALLLFALKDIAQADPTDATSLLERFVSSQPPPKAPWIADYKTLAQKYLDDCRTYVAWKNEAKSADPKTRMQKLQELRGKLKMPSALREAVSSEEKSLERQIDDQQKAANAAHEQEKKNQLQLAAQKKPRWLADWKSKLIDDLNRRHFSGAVGKDYTGIESATADRLTVRLPYGTMPISWTQLPPQTLLAISTSFIQPNAPDAADRQWLCAVYAGEIGQTDIARQLAEAAAKSKPEYRELIPVLFPR